MNRVSVVGAEEMEIAQKQPVLVPFFPHVFHVYSMLMWMLR